MVLSGSNASKSRLLIPFLHFFANLYSSRIMYKILTKRTLAQGVVLMEVEAPRVARSALPGQFMMVRAYEKGERIPLTICDYDPFRGTVTVVTQIVGLSTHLINAKEEGGYFLDFSGPLGMASEFVHSTSEEIKSKRYLFLAGGLGAAPVYPQAKYLFEKGAQVDVVIAAKTKDMLILTKEMKTVCNHLFLATDDGSEGYHGLITGFLKEHLSAGAGYDQAVAIGPMVMMKFVTITLQEFDLPLIVSLNTIMVDGTGMCGACRVSVGGKTKFACVDGPEFNGYEVDFDEAMRRQLMYKEMETAANHACKIGREGGHEV